MGTSEEVGVLLQQFAKRICQGALRNVEFQEHMHRGTFLISIGEYLKDVVDRAGTRKIEPLLEERILSKSFAKEEVTRALKALDAAGLDHEQLRVPLIAELQETVLMLERMERRICPPPAPVVNIQLPAVETTAAVCSDVHLGTKHASKDAFFGWLDGRRKGERIVLLGDILDFYIFTSSSQTAGLLQRVTAQWETLWARLAQLADKGIEVHYVPGNHDAFVFFVEAYPHLKWARTILDQTPELEELREKSMRHRLTEVATLHYPFMELPVEGIRVLLTHGHYPRWGWRMMAGLPEGNAAPSGTFLTSVAVALAHKNARLLRRLNNENDWLRRVGHIEDAGLAITNAVVVAYEGALEMARNSQAEFCAVVDKAIALHFGLNPRISPADKIEILDSMWALYRMQQRLRDEDSMQGIWSSTMDALSNWPDDESFTLPKNGTSIHPFTKRLFRSFLKPDRLVFGHYHVPRQEGFAYDVGGFVGDVSSWLAVQSDGSIVRL